MATLFFWLIILSAYHVIYESVIAPGIRMNLRFKLFSLRDWLRNLKMTHKNDLDDKIFNILDSNISSKINFLSEYNLSFLFKVVKLVNKNPELKLYVKKQTELIDNCKIREIRVINRLTGLYIVEAMLINMGAWILYLSPIISVSAILWFVFTSFKNFIVKPCKKYLSSISLVSEERYFPHPAPIHHYQPARFAS
jgi:hypothetical protein